MDWIIAVSNAERERRVLNSETTNAVYAALHTHGVALMRGLFTRGVVDGLHKEYLAQFGSFGADAIAELANSPTPHPFMRVGDRRFDIAPSMVGAFGEPEVFANGILLDILYQLLGFDMRLGGFTVVASFPDAPAQRHHRDHPHLFPEGNLGSVLPPHAINVSVPLIDVDMATGPTGIWLGSHRWPETNTGETKSMTVVPFERGDAILLDYRMLHSGVPNRSSRVRPILYMTYSRTWFFDETNYISRTPVNISLERYLKLPETARRLLLRAYSQAAGSKRPGDTTEVSGARMDPK